MNYKSILIIASIFLTIQCYYNIPYCVDYEPGLYFYPDYNCTTSDPLELQALVAFYKSTGGDNWLFKGHWMNMSMSICSWGGIACSEDCSVNTIFIANNNVTGIIPKEISNLRNLSNVYLMCNSIIGGLSNFINLDKIYEFNLCSNEIFEPVIDPNNFPMVFNFVL